jgi:hypothetical protein
MLHFFIKIGDYEADEDCMPYPWGEKGLKSFVGTYVSTDSYGQVLKSLLLKVYVKERFAVYSPEHVLGSKYSKVRAETTAAFTVREGIFKTKTTSSGKIFLAPWCGE